MKRIISTLYLIVLLPFGVAGAEDCKDVLALEKKDLVVELKFDASYEEIQKAQSTAYLNHLKKQFACLATNSDDLTEAQRAQLTNTLEQTLDVKSPNQLWVDEQSCNLLVNEPRDNKFVLAMLQPKNAKPVTREKALINLKATKLAKEIDCLYAKPALNDAQTKRLKEVSEKLYMIENTPANTFVWVKENSCELLDGDEQAKQDDKFLREQTDNMQNSKQLTSAKNKLQTLKLTQQIDCLEKIDGELTGSQKLLLADNSKKLYELKHPQLKLEEVVSTGRIISSFELGIMSLPDYADGENNGFTDTRAYFDGNIDGRFEFEDGGLVVNTTFATSFYGGGGFQEQDMEENNENGDPVVGTEADEQGFPTSFDEVSDTIDANFTLRISAYDCYWGDDEVNIVLQALSCVSASSDGKSSLGLIARYGFENKDVRTDEQDTVNDYLGWGLEYRSYRDKIQPGTNRIPDFVVSYVRSKYEEYGLIKSDSTCDVSAEGCLIPHEDATRHIVKLSYRLVEDKPFFIGFRLNGGKGPDEYGLTLGIRKSAYDILDFFGVKKF